MNVHELLLQLAVGASAIGMVSELFMVTVASALCTTCLLLALVLGA